LKFLSSKDAINEIFVDLAVHPDKWYDLALFAKVYGFLTNGKALGRDKPIPTPRI
jgi:hypothetical protein